MGNTSIEWTDKAWPVLTGCTRVSEGCRNCYSERLTATRLKNVPAYKGLATMKHGDPRWTGEVRINEKVLQDPLRWKKPSRIFVSQMSDLFHEAVPDEFIISIFDVMRRASHHTFQVLTKRAERMRDFCERLRFSGEGAGRMWLHADADKSTGYRIMGGNGCTGMTWVHLGVSCEDQPTADERIPRLLQTPAAVRFVSLEPLLGLIDLQSVFTKWVHSWPTGTYPADFPALKYYLHWVIVGGESGPHARPSHPDWIRSLRDQCVAAGVPFFFKQWGEWAPERPNNYCRLTKKKYSHETFTWAGNGEPYRSDEPDGFQNSMSVYRIGKKKAGAILDGREWREFPALP